MTYSSRNFLISIGIGNDVRVPRSNLLSSAMMSLQTSTHSSQIKTVGPAISLRTSFWSLLQNEQRRISVSPFFLTMPYAGYVSMLHPFADDVIDYPVFLPLVRRHDVIAFSIVLDSLECLPGVVHQDFVEPLAHAQNFPRMNIDVGRLSRQPLHQGLMDHDAGVRQREALALSLIHI